MTRRWDLLTHEKIWALMGLLFDPSKEVKLPAFAIESMWIAAIAAVPWTIAEWNQRIRRYLPCSIGLGLGLILPVVYDVGFFAGMVLMWIILRRAFKVSGHNPDRNRGSLHRGRRHGRNPLRGPENSRRHPLLGDSDFITPCPDASSTLSGAGFSHATIPS